MTKSKDKLSMPLWPPIFGGWPANPETTLDIKKILAMENMEYHMSEMQQELIEKKNHKSVHVVKMFSLKKDNE